MIAVLLSLFVVVASSTTGAIVAAQAVRAKLAARRQAAWERHVDEAVQLSETAIHDRLVHEQERGLDAEWRRANADGWATS